MHRQGYLFAVLLTLLFGFSSNARSDSSEKLVAVLDDFSFFSKTVPEELLLIQADVNESVNVIFKQLTQVERSSDSRLNLMVLLDLLQGRNPEIVQRVSKCLADIAKAPTEEKRLRKQAAKTIKVESLANEEILTLMQACLNDIQQGDLLTLMPILASLPGKHEFPKTYKKEAMASLTNALAKHGGHIRLLPLVEFCRRLDEHETEAILFRVLRAAMDKPLTFRDIWDVLLSDSERRNKTKFYEMVLTVWIDGGSVRDSATIARLTKGFEKCGLVLLIHNLESDNPHARVDAAIALKELYGAKIDFNPVGDADERQRAVDEWKRFASQYSPKGKSEETAQGAAPMRVSVPFGVEPR